MGQAAEGQAAVGQAAEGLWLVVIVLDHTARHGSYPGPSFVPDDGQGQGATGEGNTRQHERP